MWSTKANSYFTSQNNLLNSSEWNLPFWKPTDPLYPDTQQCYGVRETPQIETSPSEGTMIKTTTPTLPKPSRSSITEPTPTLPPATIVQLADQLENTAVFADIAEALEYEPTQLRKDYLPATLPEPTRKAMTNPEDEMLAM
jgi:hypothetical protein